MMIETFLPRWLSRLTIFVIVISGCPRNTHGLSLSFENKNNVHKVRLMTYNIHAWRDSHHRCNFDRVVDVVNQVQPDILCLNEVLHSFARPQFSSSNQEQQQRQQEYYDLVQSGKARNVNIDSMFIPTDVSQSFLHVLSQETNLRHVDFKGATDNSYFGKGISFGNALLSRFPIVHSCHQVLGIDDGDLDLGNQERSFVDPRVFSKATISPSKGVNIGICYTHLDHKSEELREKQVQKGLLGLHAEGNMSSNMPLVICGDFNTFQKSDCSANDWKAILDLYQGNNWPAPPEDSLALKALKNAGFHDAFYTAAFDNEKVTYPHPTCWTHKPLMRIDHIWILDNDNGISGQKVDVAKYERVESAASDHYPIWVDLEIS